MPKKHAKKTKFTSYDICMVSIFFSYRIISLFLVYYIGLKIASNVPTVQFLKQHIIGGTKETIPGNNKLHFKNVMYTIQAEIWQLF